MGQTYLKDSPYDIEGLTGSTRDKENRKILRTVFQEMVTEYPKQCEFINNVFLNYSLAMGSLVANQMAVNHKENKKKIPNFPKNENTSNGQNNETIMDSFIMGKSGNENNKSIVGNGGYNCPLITTCGEMPK